MTEDLQGGSFRHKLREVIVGQVGCAVDPSGESKRTKQTGSGEETGDQHCTW